MASSSSFLMASQTLILKNPNFLSPRKPKTLSLFSPPKQPLNLTHAHSLTPTKSSRIFASSHPPHSLLSGSTRTITTILSITLTISNLFASKLSTLALKLNRIFTTPTPEEFATIQTLQDNLVCTIGPLFFAALKDRPSGYLNTPLTVVASGMAKWLDIYSGVLMVRVLLSWFPNIPWDRQPLSAIRDLCDPYLNLFRNIIPPIFDTLDVSPLFAFAVLGTLGSILNNSRGAY